MVLFTHIDCIQKDGTLVIGVHGTIAPQSSDALPTKGAITAKQDTSGVLQYRFPNGKVKLIRYWTMNNTRCFFLEGDEIGKNYLEQFPECENLPNY